MLHWFRAPRHLLAWFVVVTAVPTVVLFADRAGASRVDVRAESAEFGYLFDG